MLPSFLFGATLLGMKPQFKTIKTSCGNKVTLTAPSKELLAERVAQSNKDHREGRGCPACNPVKVPG
jgi:hypothetical protein